MRKLVLTPPTSTATVAWRGKPLCSEPTSVVVPPISTTIASATPDRNAAPRIELVGPEAKVSTGKRLAKSASISVPSFCVRKNRPRDAGAGDGPAEGVDHLRRNVAQAGVHDRRVLALEQPDPADLARKGDVRARQFPREDLACLLLESIRDRRKHRGDGDGADALGADVGGDADEFVFIQRRDLAAVEFVAAMGEVAMVADGLLQVLGPIHHRRQRGGRRQAKPHGGRRREASPLDDGIGEMRRADHDHVDRVRRKPGALQHRVECGDDARHHVLGRRRLDARDDLLAVHHDGIRVRAADVDSDPDHACFPSLKMLAPDASPCRT